MDTYHLHTICMGEDLNVKYGSGAMNQDQKLQKECMKSQSVDQAWMLGTSHDASTLNPLGFMDVHSLHSF